MFLILAAFIIWLFATGEYSAWAGLLTAPANSANATAATSTATTTASPAKSTTNTGGLNIGSLLGSMTSNTTASENPGASATSTPQDLISGYTG